jgi:transcriptional regulator with XRE-family HTH domain
VHIAGMEARKTPLATWMADNGKTDQAVAAALNITRSQVNRVRNGVSNPSIATATALSLLTGIPIQNLFQRSADANERAAA